MSAVSPVPGARTSNVSRDVAARLVGVSAKRLDQLVGEGWIRRAGRNEYAVVDVVQGYIRFLRDGLERKDDRNAEPNALTDSRIREIELRIEERADRLIDREEHKAVLEEILGMVREEFVALPGQITRDAERKRDLEDRVDSILDRVERRLALLDQNIGNARKGRR